MLITEEYRNQLQELHKETYGIIGKYFAGNLAALCKHFGVTECLDYGCGKQRVRDILAADGITVHGYDPAIAEVSQVPSPHDVVCSFDVLEHIEPELLENVLKDLHRVTRKMLLCTVSTQRALKFLPDGRNAHLIIEPKEWWMKRLYPYFKHAAQPEGDDKQFVCYLRPREQIKGLIEK